MALSSAPITPTRPGAPSRVIQGSFVGGRPKIVQAAPLAPAPARPQVPGPVQGCQVPPATSILAGRPSTGAVQPMLRPGQLQDQVGDLVQIGDALVRPRALRRRQTLDGGLAFIGGRGQVV